MCYSFFISRILGIVFINMYRIPISTYSCKRFYISIAYCLRITSTHTNFYFFNNGLTLVCNDFSYNALQSSDYQVRVENLQIVNGGQTCMTILKTADALAAQGQALPADASVLVRIYKLPKDNDDIVLQITQATNSQNPVDLKDLRANDEIQRQLEASIQSLGYHYRRKRSDGAAKPTDITAGAAAEALLSVWRHAPHQAKFLTREHFGKLYPSVFPTSVNGTQVVLVVATEPSFSDEFLSRCLCAAESQHLKTLIVLNKCDLLPYLEFDADLAEANARRVNPNLTIFRVSETSGDGMSAWLDWIQSGLEALRGKRSESIDALKRRVAELERCFDADPQLAVLTVDLMEEVALLRKRVQKAVDSGND